MVFDFALDFVPSRTVVPVHLIMEGNVFPYRRAFLVSPDPICGRLRPRNAPVRVRAKAKFRDG